ncbi:MAG: hypothetical protein HY870_10905 [Chloroflexi bacterium]|nr:hypothetical protein [Chloroflexota bacterium]
MDKTIVTALLIIAGVISAILVFNSISPAIQQSGAAMNSMERRLDERMQSQIEIIHATRSGNTAVIWVKNVGSLRIAPPEACDLFFGPDNNFTRIGYGAGSGSPYWDYVIENDTEWRSRATLKITVHYPVPPASGTYFVKLVLPNGISTEIFASW